VWCLVVSMSFIVHAAQVLRSPANEPQSSRTCVFCLEFCFGCVLCFVWCFVVSMCCVVRAMRVPRPPAHEPLYFYDHRIMGVLLPTNLYTRMQMCILLLCGLSECVCPWVLCLVFCRGSCMQRSTQHSGLPPTNPCHACVCFVLFGVSL